jgi:glycosyltransferase involved in cell wall biosynthesis
MLLSKSKNLNEIFEESVMVIAHPDDEVLWFSSILDKVDGIIVCFLGIKNEPEKRTERQNSLSEHPFHNKILNLGLDQSGTFYGIDWGNPVVTDYGLEVSDKNYPDRVYRENYLLLKKYLEDKLYRYSNVFTHNPWGEYGHNEHVQVYRVLKELQNSMKFTLWFSNYYSNKASTLMSQYMPIADVEYVTFTTNRELADKIKQVYQNNNCWTWYDTWEWPVEEAFIRDGTQGNKRKLFKKCCPLNLIKLDDKNNSDSLHLFDDIKKYLKAAIKFSALKCGIEIRRHIPDQLDKVITLKPEHGYKGNVLISYILQPFLLESSSPLLNTHAHFWRTWQMAQTFVQLGYCVDVIDYHNNEFTPEKDYVVFIDVRRNLERLGPLLNRNCIKIFYIDTAHMLFHNYAECRRLLYLQQRRGVTLLPWRYEIPNLGIEHADCAIVAGNEFTINTFKYANKLIYRVPLSACAVYPWPEEKNYAACRNNFLWLSSHGMVHKGLDLALEAFAEMPDHHLYVCAPVQNEEDFEKTYYKELYQTSNIHTIGWIDIGSPLFLELTNKCVAVVGASCSEGVGGSIINCMHAGLIPIVSYETSVDVFDFGIVFDDCTPAEIKKNIDAVSNLSREILCQMSRKAWEHARANHTRERFTEEYRKTIELIINIYSHNKEPNGLN